MTREELIRDIRGWEVEYSFKNLPKEHLDKDLIKEWLSGPYGELSQVPKHLLDDDIRRHAITFYHENCHDIPLKSILVSDTPNYEELALLALGQSSTFMAYVDPSVYSEAFFLKALQASGASMMHFDPGKGNAKIEWTEAMIDAAVSQSCSYLSYFHKSQIKKESFKRMLLDGVASAIHIANAGFADFIVDAMRDGYWPKDEKKPSSLDEAFYFLQDAKKSSRTREIYYTAFVRHLPMEEVLPLMKSPELQDLMLEIYSTEELMPHLRTGFLKSAHRVRGHLLGEGLGL
jgi:hypothetical protein